MKQQRDGSAYKNPPSLLTGKELEDGSQYSRVSNRSLPYGLGTIHTI
ncbi:hypothetical protein [Fodinibius salsisoli]|uniref:Uncharacterized protein n=1 Tax=Fodinibius salsisoli TaxID=2820877 RepID=A0ABT3PMJ2_9BACT|nr:hypothetical protein [Fodinibius salsisoli]MCW9707129.1 hypothetical protein [Fodinibius salsisoli]